MRLDLGRVFFADPGILLRGDFDEELERLSPRLFRHTEV